MLMDLGRGSESSRPVRLIHCEQIEYSEENDRNNCARTKLRPSTVFSIATVRSVACPSGPAAFTPAWTRDANPGAIKVLGSEGPLTSEFGHILGAPEAHPFICFAIFHWTGDSVRTKRPISFTGRDSLSGQASLRRRQISPPL